MDFLTIGLVSIIALLVIVLMGCPVGLAMILMGFGGFALMIGIDPALSVLETAAWERPQTTASRLFLCSC